MSGPGPIAPRREPVESLDRPWVAIAANPYSGSRENRARVRLLVEALGRVGLDVQEVWDTRSLDRLREDPRFASHCRCVVAAGGDGTVSRVINHQLQVPVAALPLGTENLFAAHLGFGRDAQKLAAAIAAGRTRTIDLGRFGEELFSVVVSAGFDGDVAHRLARWRTRGETLRRVRRHSYLRPIAASAMSYGYPMIDVEVDGQTLRGSLVMVFNIPRYGFGFELAPQARDDDGLLDYIVFQKPGRVALGSYYLALLLRRHLAMKSVEHGRARRITLRSAQGSGGEVPLEADGEAAGFTPRDISVLPKALHVIAM